MMQGDLRGYFKKGLKSLRPTPSQNARKRLLDALRVAFEVGMIYLAFRFYTEHSTKPVTQAEFYCDGVTNLREEEDYFTGVHKLVGYCLKEGKP